MRPAWRLLCAMGDAARLFALLMLLPVPVALLYDARDLDVQGVLLPTAAVVFPVCAAFVAALGQSLRMGPGRGQELVEREAYVAVAGAWLLVGTLGALPLLWHMAPIDAWFESMSGATATGATTLAQVEALPPSMIFWRSLLQFAAGLGVVTVMVALLARLTHGGMQLLPSDFGAAGSRVRPKLREAAGAIWKVYALLTAVLAIGYFAAMRLQAGLPAKTAAFDALVHAGSTISAGGFSSRTASIGFYESWAVELVAVVGMLVAGTSFALVDHARGRWSRLLADREWRFYMLLVALGGLATSGLLFLAGQAVADALRAGFFTIISIGTTTGYATVDHDAWHPLARTGLIVAMFTGAMVGSTAGGIKLLRILLLLKVARREVRKLLHPRAVMPIRHGGRAVQEPALLAIIAFFFLYISVWTAATAILIALEPGLGLFEGGATAAAAMGNVGPGMGPVGPFGHYGGLGAASKVLLGTLMWLGRLEIFSILLLVSPGSWRK